MFFRPKLVIKWILGYFKITKRALIFQAESNISDGLYWTSGTLDSCTNNYSWCFSDKDSKFVGRNIIWGPGQPAAAAGKCLALSLSKSDALLTTADCAGTNKVICEVCALKENSLYHETLNQNKFKVRNTSSNPLPNKAMQEECAANYDITEGYLLFVTLLLMLISTFSWNCIYAGHHDEKWCTT